MTGVWADKHGVHDNSFKGAKYDETPCFFTLLKQQRPQALTASYVDWAAIRDATLQLATGDSDLIFVYLGQVDEHGHKYGFHPSVTEYRAAIERVDACIGELIAAIRERKTYEQEDWLIISTTDHGGSGKGHGKGHALPEINTTWFLVSGPAARRGILGSPTNLVDVVPTALVHLGVNIDPKWKLDGKAVGLK